MAGDYAKSLPFPIDGTVRTNWYTPRFNTLSKPHQFHNQWLFWKAYSEEEQTWEDKLPMKLRWRRKQLLRSILDVLRKLKNPPVAGKYMYELSMLQRGWDDLMKAISQFLAARRLDPWTPPKRGMSPSSWQTPEYIAHYAGADSSALNSLYDAPPINVVACYDMGMDPLRPEVAIMRSGDEKSPPTLWLGPILTNPMGDGEVATYRCGVVGCRGAWWFETALKQHQKEMPHPMLGANWWVAGSAHPTN